MTLPPQHIQDFCFRWLNPKVRRFQTADDWQVLIDACSQLKGDWQIVSDIMQRINYSEDFVKTLYWRVIADETKRRAGHVCQACGTRRGALEVHHLTYDNHGNEHLHMEDLQAWCLVCHNLHHGQVLKAIFAEYAYNRDHPRNITDWCEEVLLFSDGFVLDIGDKDVCSS